MRLLSTKNIYNNKNQSIMNVLLRVDRQIAVDYKRLNHLKGSILRASNPKTLKRLAAELGELAEEMGHKPPDLYDKAKLLKRIEKYKQQNIYLKYAALNQSVIGLCVNYEDFIRRIIMKYYEEDIRRLTSKKQSISHAILVKAMLRGDNLHHTLAQKVTEDLMYGSVEDWHSHLRQVVGMQTQVPKEVREVFLIRHCLIHNNNKVSGSLHEASPSTYRLRDHIRSDIRQVEEFRDRLHRSVGFLISEYDRLFPRSKGSWVKIFPSKT